MASDEQHTCGKGIAASGALPEKMSAVLRVMADVHQNHIRSLNPDEPNGKLEIAAYESLVAENRDLARRLDALAHLMRGYRDLPMPSHDMDVLTDQHSTNVFKALVDRERDLLTLMQERVKEWDSMLEGMGE